MNFKKRREELNLTQEQVARAIGLSQQAIAKWETGESLPRAEMLPRLAKILSCTIDELLAAADESNDN